MFGQQNNQSDHHNAPIPDQSIEGVLTNNATPPAADDAGAAADKDWQHPGAPLDDSTTVAPSDATTPPLAPVIAPSPSVSVSPSPSTAVGDHDSTDLIDIKQQALNQLAPLVSHLDQSPEDKFRTLMMMIQASDDQSKIKEAYDAAQAIPDEKVRAQALLDIVNEINYFTQNHTPEA